MKDLEAAEKASEQGRELDSFLRKDADKLREEKEDLKVYLLSTFLHILARLYSYLLLCISIGWTEQEGCQTTEDGEGIDQV